MPESGGFRRIQNPANSFPLKGWHMAKSSKSKKASISLEGEIPKLSLRMPLDAQKIKEIQRCIAKGELKITINKVDLAAGRIGEAWLYD